MIDWRTGWIAGAGVAGAIGGIAVVLNAMPPGGKPVSDVVAVIAGGGLLAALAMRAWLRHVYGEPASVIRVAPNADGLPQMRWEEVRRQGGALDLRFGYARCLSVVREADGALTLVHEAIEDANAKAILVLGVGGVWLARRLGFGRSLVAIERRPWGTLEGFIVTNEADWQGVRTGGGDRPKDPQPVILADFGLAGGKVVVSWSEASPAVIAERHRLLTRLFVVDRQQVMAGAPARDARAGA